MLYFLIFTFAYLFVILIALTGIDSWTNNYPKHIEDRSFLDDVYDRAEKWCVSADGRDAPDRVRQPPTLYIVKSTRDVRAK